MAGKDPLNYYSIAFNDIFLHYYDIDDPHIIVYIL